MGIPSLAVPGAERVLYMDVTRAPSLRGVLISPSGWIHLTPETVVSISAWHLRKLRPTHFTQPWSEGARLESQPPDPRTVHYKQKRSTAREMFRRKTNKSSLLWSRTSPRAHLALPQNPFGCLDPVASMYQLPSFHFRTITPKCAECVEDADEHDMGTMWKQAESMRKGRKGQVQEMLWH